MVLRLLKRYVIVFAAATAFIYTLHNSFQQRKKLEVVANANQELPASSAVTETLRNAKPDAGEDKGKDIGGVKNEPLKFVPVEDKAAGDKAHAHPPEDLTHDEDDDIYVQLRDGKGDPFPKSGKFPLQLNKLKRYHGAIAEKNPPDSDYYEGVVYPRFVDEHVPGGMGKYVYM